ncbi:hypothetical protein [Nocardia heshunensis]
MGLIVFVVAIMTAAWWNDVNNDGFAAHPTQFAFCVVGWIVAVVALVIDARPARVAPRQPDAASRAEWERELADRELADFRTALGTIAVLIAPERPALSAAARIAVASAESHSEARAALLDILLAPSDGVRALAELDLDDTDSRQYDDLLPPLLRSVARYSGRPHLVPFLIYDEDLHRGYLVFVTRTRTTTLTRLAGQTELLLYAAEVTR